MGSALESFSNLGWSNAGEKEENLSLNHQPGEVLERVGRVPNVVVRGFKLCPHLYLTLLNTQMTLDCHQMLDENYEVLFCTL